MISHCFHIEFSPQRSLQEQLKEALISAILAGAFPEHEALPSCRTLSQQLSVSRNTVALVYEHLLDDGYLISRQRSGYYLHPNYYAKNRVQQDETNPYFSEETYAPKWEQRLQKSASDYMGTRKPSNWSQFEYPFIYGQVDVQNFPLDEWRKTAKQILGGGRDITWVNDYIDQDDENLIEQIRTRVLPKRGIIAKSDEILITMGSQNALYLIANLLFNQQTKVAIETPGYIDAFNISKIHDAQILYQPIDNNGLIIDEALADADYLYITPSHQVPTGVVMNNERRTAILEHAKRYDQIIIEDDYDAEINFDQLTPPAMKSIDKNHRIIYISSFSKALSPGLRMGYLVADAELIDELKALRRLMYRHPPVNTQYQLAQFLAQGYYDRYLRQRCDDMKHRWELMSHAIDRYLPYCKQTDTAYTSSFWLKSPNDYDAQRLCWKAAQSSILIEAGSQHYFQFDSKNKPFFRMGFTAINESKIEKGIQQLSRLFECYL